MTVNVAPAKPRLRGVFHELGFYASLGVGATVVATAEPGRPRAAAVVFATCVAVCFGASAVYHRPTWTPRPRAWLARADHAAVYLLVAGTYAPFGLIVMSPGWAVPVLSVVWGGAFAAILVKLVWLEAPKWLSAAFALALGWTGVVAFSELLVLPVGGLVLLVVGGLLYTAGAIVYVCRWPNPVPHAFGYHEVFHLLTVGAVGCQYTSIALFVLPYA